MSVNIKIRSGTLGQFGYTNVLNLSLKKRRKALDKAIKNEGALPIFRKLNAVYVLNKNNNPKLANRFKLDRNYVRKYF